MNSSVNINNKKAKYDYSLLDKYTCGIVLTGNEIKSIRNSKASLNNAYCEFEGDELFVVNMHIDLYENSSETNYDPKRRRKLLNDELVPLNPISELSGVETKTRSSDILGGEGEGPLGTLLLEKILAEDDRFDKNPKGLPS